MAEPHGSASRKTHSKLCFIQKHSFVCGKKNSNNNMKKTFGSGSVFFGLVTIFSPVRRVFVATTHRRPHYEPFVPVLSRLHKRIVLLLRLSDCLTGYHSPSAITRSLGLWFLSATSRSFHWLWLPPEGFRPTAPHLFYSA